MDLNSRSEFYFRKQQQQLFHNHVLNQYLNNQPLLNQGYQNRNFIGGGENLDQQVDHFQQDHPGLSLQLSITKCAPNWR